MSESSFPGSNPFAKDRANMQRLDEDSELRDPTSPDTRKMATADTAAPPTFTGTFGEAGFNPSAGAEQPHSNYNFGRRTSVSAESMNPAGRDNDNWKPPVHPKSDEQKSRLHKAVSPNFLFSHLDDDQTTTVLNALQEKKIPSKGIKVIQQGEQGDYFYVVENGTFEVFVHPSGALGSGQEGLGKKVATIEAGGSFGELALMYNAPRAATVQSTEPATLWALDRVTFRRILMDSAFQRRQMYENFLGEVPLLESLTPYEKAKIADALHTQKYPAGNTIIKEGDPGEQFFIVERGDLEVFKEGTDGPVHKYSKGDYFGELALLDDKPRAASVVSKTEVKLAMLGKEGFQRLLGPVNELMRRNDPSRSTTQEASSGK